MLICCKILFRGDSMRLKELRLQKHESQQKLAGILNISQTMISRYENGDAYPDIDILIAIAKHYNVSLDFLMEISDNKLPYTKSNLPKQEQDLLFLFKQLNSTQKEKAVSFIQGMLALEEKSM